MLWKLEPFCSYSTPIPPLSTRFCQMFCSACKCFGFPLWNMRKCGFPYLNEYERGCWSSCSPWKICFVLGWITLEHQEMWLLLCGKSLYCVYLRYVQNWCRVKDPVTALLGVCIQVACSDVIIGWVGQAVIVRWLIDPMNLFFCKCVTNISPVILILTHRTCHVRQGVESVSECLAGNAMAVCMPASVSGWAIALYSLGVLICISLCHLASDFSMQRARTP